MLGWAYTRKKNKVKHHIAHLMQDTTKAACGKTIKYHISVMEGWNPEDHLTDVCPECLAWWKRIHGIKGEAVV